MSDPRTHPPAQSLVTVDLTLPVSSLPVLDAATTALRVVNHISAMVSYWDAEQRCVFSNDAYWDWFGKAPEDMVGMTLLDLVGPELYQKKLPFILGALQGNKQIFERQIRVPNGEIRESITTYTPDVVNGRVLGFSVHVADVTQLRQREAVLKQTIQDAILVLKKTKGSFQSKELGLLREQLVQLDREVSRQPLLLPSSVPSLGAPPAPLPPDHPPR